MSSKCLLKNLNHVRISAAVTLAFPRARNFYFLIRGLPFSTSAPKSIESCSKRNSFTVDYLVNWVHSKKGSSSLYMKFEAADKPDSVLTFFKDYGFTQTQILKIINHVPLILTSDPQKTLLPKLEFFKAKGISTSDIAVITSTWPNLSKRSLEHQLIPSFDFFSNLLLSNERENINAFKRCVGAFLFDLEKHGAANIEILKKAGVPLKNIRYLLANQPRSLLTSCGNFQQIVDAITDMDFDPLKITFVVAVITLRSITKSMWNTKLKVYDFVGG